MFRIELIVVDRTKSPFLQEGEKFYIERLRPYAKTRWVVVKPEKAVKGRPPEEVVSAEGLSILKKLDQHSHIMVLDRGGRSFGSNEFAAYLERTALQNSRFSFVIGGPLGLSPAVREAGQAILALSKFTLTHEMSRLILLEQLYRAFTIIHGTNYHK